MRRLWLFGVGLLLSAVIGAGAPVAFPSFTVSAQQKRVDPATITVYVTKTGEKYHRDGCRYLRQSRIPISLKEAARRYGPCSVCKPPTLN
jgi:cbb3-type cytochrome oxidase cytochrome c subunit